MLNSFGRAVIAAVVAGLAYMLWRAFHARRTPDLALEAESAPFPFPAAPRPPELQPPELQPSELQPSELQLRVTTSRAEVAAWVEPVEGGCPATHPVKAKLSSGIFHVPGGQNYARTRPDRCYRDAGTAEADGLRRSQR